jgi:peptidoglycan hydrolase-like protein with peptidoglycan-binding domain
VALKIPRFASNAALQLASEDKALLQQGARGEDVAILQQALIDLGFSMPNSTRQGNALPDGIFGHETTATVKKFQRVNRLHVDGIVGRQTLTTLEKAIILASSIDQVRFSEECSREKPIA